MKRISHHRFVHGVGRPGSLHQLCEIHPNRFDYEHPLAVGERNQPDHKRDDQRTQPGKLHDYLQQR